MFRFKVFQDIFKIQKSFCVATILILLSSLPVNALPRRLKIGATAGKVKVDNRRAYRGQAIRRGNQIVTSSFFNRRQSKAVIRFDLDQGIGLIGPRSSIKVSRLRRYRGGAQTHFLISRGGMWASLRKFNNKYSEVVFQYKNGPRQVIAGAVEDAEFGVSHDGETGAIISKSGSAAVFDGDRSTVVGPGEGVIIGKDGKIGEAVPASQELAHEGVGLKREGGGWLVTGRVVNSHCVLDSCINEPLAFPVIKFLDEETKGDRFGFFSLNVRAPTANTSLEIAYNGQQAIISLEDDLRQKFP